MLANTEDLEQDVETLSVVYSEQMGTLRRYMEENTRQVQNQAEYSERFNEMSAACTETETKIDRVKEEILVRHGRKKQICRCLEELKLCGDILEAFDVDLWNTFVETVRINADKIFVFCFRDGTEISVNLPEKK